MKKVSLYTSPLQEKEILKELTYLLNTTIEREGQALWMKHFQEKSVANSANLPLLNASLTDLKSLSLRLVKESLVPGLNKKFRLLAKNTLRGTALFTSTIFGACLPQNDLVLYKKEQKQDAITLKNASLFSVELILEWTQSILERTTARANEIENLKFRFEVLNHLARSKELLGDCLMGVQKGSVLRRLGGKALTRISKRPTPSIRVPLDGKAYQMMEHFFSTLLGAYKTKGSENHD